MSKPSVSPYRRNAYNNPRAGVSPLRDQPHKLAEKSKLSHSYIAEQHNDRRNTNSKQETVRMTEKKRAYDYVPTASHSRLDTLVQQNKFLLAENNELANLLNDRSRVIIALEQKLEQQIAQEVQTLEEIEFEKNRFLEQYAMKMKQHSNRNERLMDEIAQLNEDIYQLEVKKSRDIEQIKDSYSREHKIQLDNILNNHTQTVELMQIENSKLKELIGNRDNEIQCLNHQLKSNTDRLKGKCDQLEKNINHILHMKKLELSEQKIQYEKIIQDVKKQCAKLQQVNNIQYENQIKRVKKQLLHKQVEVAKLGNDLSDTHIDSQIRINELNQKKAELENEISELENFQKTLIFQQTEKIKNFAQTELEYTDNMHRQINQSLKQQNQKLAKTNQIRANQVMQLYVQIEDLRFKHERQCDDLRLQISNLKQIIQSDKECYELQSQALKGKLAQLRHADLHSLQNYYQNQLATMTQGLDQKQRIIQATRDKLHQEIQDKTQLRKHFQVELSKLKITIGQLELRIAHLLNQKKQQIANVGSQMQLTSMTLLRTTEEKEKYAAFSQSEKQRLQTMIQKKDLEIEQLNQKIRIMNQNHAEENRNNGQQIDILKKTIEELETNLKKEKFFLQNQIRKKESIHRNDKQFYESELARIKRQSSDEYNRMLQQLNREKALLDDQRIRLRIAQKQLSGQLKQVKQFREQENIDREIAINQHAGRATSQKEILEINLKTYYQKELAMRDDEIRDLRQQIGELNTDIRNHIQKQQKLEEKLQRLLESQERLRDMEQRVLALGQENNLVKNLSEIVKNRRK